MKHTIHIISRHHTIFLLLFLILLSIFVFLGLQSLRKENQRDELRNKIIQISSKIENNIFLKLSGISRSIADNQEVKKVLTEEALPDNRNVLMVLETMRASLHASLVYVMNEDGTVVASTRYDGDKTLTGNNYSFRPYFKGAMAGRDIVYPAVGVTTHKRGLYFSSPVYGIQQNRPIGVVVMKVGLEEVDTILQAVEDPAAVVSSEGIIFATNRPSWLYHSLHSLTEDERNTLRKSRQFADMNITALDIAFRKDTAIIDAEKYYITRNPFLSSGWEILLSEPVRKYFPLTHLQKMIFGSAAGSVAILATIISILIANIRKRRQAERKITSSEKRLRTILDTTIEGFWQVNEHAIVVSTNPSMRTILRVERENDIIRRSIYDFVDEENAAIIREQLRLRSEGKTSSYEVRLKRADHTSVSCLINATPLFDHQGNKAGSFAMVTDISLRKQAEEELKGLKDNLEIEVEKKTQELINAQKKLVQSERLAAMGQLGSTIAHEFRNELGVMRNITFFLKMKLPESDDKIQKHLQILEEEVVRTDRIIENILMFARERKPEFQQVNLKEVLTAVVGRIQMNIPSSVNCRTEFTEDIPHIQADEVQITQIFSNIINNALEAVGEHGEVIITAVPYNTCVTVTVEDNGPGMSDEIRTKIFEPLFSTKARGTGLGLATVKVLVEQHNGEIYIDTVEEKGTKVTVMLPIVQKETTHT